MQLGQVHPCFRRVATPMDIDSRSDHSYTTNPDYQMAAIGMEVSIGLVGVHCIDDDEVAEGSFRLPEEVEKSNSNHFATTFFY